MAIDESTFRQLIRTRTVDLTTIGRRSGRPSRVEIWWFHFEGRFVITGTPGRRDWLANIRSNPAVIVHAAGNDHPGTAAEVDDRTWRRRFFAQPESEVGWYRTQSELERLVSESPMIQIFLDGSPTT